MSNQHQILVVEDELELAKSTLSFLLENDFLPFHAKDLKTARKLLKQKKFTAVLLDLGLPDGDGMSLIKEIKNFKEEIGLIIISAKDELRTPSLFHEGASKIFFCLIGFLFFLKDKYSDFKLSSLV